MNSGVKKGSIITVRMRLKGSREDPLKLRKLLQQVVIYVRFLQSLKNA